MMNRADFRKRFDVPGPAVFPVIHVLDADQAARNAETALRHGTPGVFLINHDFPKDELVPIIAEVRRRLPELWLGVNFLAVTGRVAFPVLGELAASGTRVDGYWGDDARIDERAVEQGEAMEIDVARTASGWNGLYFGGTAFKKQREVAPQHYELSARLATAHMDVVTTSGVATGQAADLAKIEAMRAGCGDHAMGIASGVTPDNVHRYAPLVDAILVATGINVAGDFYNIDPAKLERLMTIVRDLGGLE